MIPRVLDASEVCRGREVRVYWNLHRRCYSVQAKVGGRWRVACHAESVGLRLAQPIVFEAGRRRVLREQRKSVHAYILGLCVDQAGLEAGADVENEPVGQRLRYNPYTGPTWTEGRDGTPAARIYDAVAMYRSYQPPNHSSGARRSPVVYAWGRGLGRARAVLR